jgi:hypothetical protein
VRRERGRREGYRVARQQNAHTVVILYKAVLMEEEKEGEEGRENPCLATASNARRG